MAIGRSFLRIGVTAASGGFFVVLGTIFRQNIENWSADHGFDRLFSEAWDMIGSTTWEAWALYAFIFFFGATVALWLDWLMRRGERKSDAQARPESPHQALADPVSEWISIRDAATQIAPDLDGTRIDISARVSADFEGCESEYIRIICNEIFHAEMVRVRAQDGRSGKIKAMPQRDRVGLRILDDCSTVEVVIGKGQSYTNIEVEMRSVELFVSQFKAD